MSGYGLCICAILFAPLLAMITHDGNILLSVPHLVKVLVKPLTDILFNGILRTNLIEQLVFPRNPHKTNTKGIPLVTILLATALGILIFSNSFTEFRKCAKCFAGDRALRVTYTRQRANLANPTVHPNILTKLLSQLLPPLPFRTALILVPEGPICSILITKSLFATVHYLVDNPLPLT